MSVHRKKKSCACPQGVEVVKENWPFQVVCCRARDKTGKLAVEVRKESEGILPDFQASMASGFPGRECLQVLVGDTKR